MPRLSVLSRASIALSVICAAPLAFVSAQGSPIAPPPQAYLPYIANSSAAAPTTPVVPTPTSPTTPTTNLDVSAATYLGGAGADAAHAAAIAPDGSLLVGGAFPGYSPAGITSASLLGGGNGAVVRLSASGDKLLGLTRIGASVDDMEISSAGQLVACGAFGVAVLSADAAQLTWSASPGAVTRCAIGSDGSVAALVGKTASVYSAAGALLKSWPISGSSVNDIAIDGASKRVVAVGYTQKNVAGNCSGLLKVAFMRAWDYSGQSVWQNYDWSAQQANAVSLCADSDGRRVTIGADGRLYFAGWTDGGNTIYSRDPKNSTASLSSSQSIKTDVYNNPYQLKGALSLAWFGRFSPATGALDSSSFLLTRKDNNDGNSISIKSITADASGRVFIAGEAYYQIKDRSRQSVGGITVGSYEGGEAYLLALSADLKTRLAWTVFAAPGSSAGGSGAEGLAVGGGRVALTATLNPKTGGTRSLITVRAIQAQPATLPDGYLVVWPVP